MPNETSTVSDGGGRNGDGGAWGSVSYAEETQFNFTSLGNLTEDEYLERMLGPKQVYFD